MVRLIIIAFLSSSHLHAQFEGSYWGNGRLELKSDSSYVYHKGACIAYYSELGKYSVREDTIRFFRKDSCCIECFDTDSNAFHLNEDNLFILKTYRITKCKNSWEESDMLARVLFYRDGELYTKKIHCSHISVKPISRLLKILNQYLTIRSLKAMP
ncbi:MAG: hypothetical protein U0T74_05640 [Chitinophagales bacterium]